MGIKFEPIQCEYTTGDKKVSPPERRPPPTPTIGDDSESVQDDLLRVISFTLILSSCALIFGLAFLCFAWGWRILNG